jgi:hypothetical protein
MLFHGEAAKNDTTKFMHICNVYFDHGCNTNGNGISRAVKKLPHFPNANAKA